MHRQAVLAVVSLGVTVWSAGCASRPYEDDYVKRVQAFRGDAVFAALKSAPDEFLNGRVRMQLPRQFGPPKAGDEAEAKVRARPPFLAAVPGFQTAVEVMLQKPQNTFWPAVLAVGVEPAAARPPGDVKGAILQLVKMLDPAAAWTPKTVEPRGGGPAAWDVISLRRDQPFSVQVGNEYVDKNAPGICDIWVSSDPKQEFCTVLVLRLPEEVADMLEVPSDQLMELVARTVQTVEPPADEAAQEPQAK
ncbi:MAG: hypothetical protein ACKO4T_02530 [Planctomycetaceae bacterium]